jgi:hypothetical protein
MSRAFVSEDSGGPGPEQRYRLPSRDDPGYAAAAARVLIQGANEGDTDGAEEATGYRFGEPALVPYVLEILDSARRERNDRREQLAERFLSRAGYEETMD